MKNMKTKIGIVVVALIFGIAAVVMAHDWDDQGYGGSMMGPGYGGHMMGRGMMGYGPGYRGQMMGNGPYGYNGLSREEAAKLEQTQEKFFNDTRDLRNNIEQKQLTLNQELQQSNPDRDRVLNLQKELSQLESQYDQKALEHRLELRKTFPENAIGMGYGRGAYCW
jgi:hypothetical protein